jgi:hypothetical protein
MALQKEHILSHPDGIMAPAAALRTSVYCADLAALHAEALERRVAMVGLHLDWYSGMKSLVSDFESRTAHVSPSATGRASLGDVGGA